MKDLKEALESNNFEVYLANNASDAKDIVSKDIFPKLQATSVSWGGSMTFIASGLYEYFKTKENIKVILKIDSLIDNQIINSIISTFPSH